MDNIKVSKLYKLYENKNLHMYETGKETHTHIILDAELFRYAHSTIKIFSLFFTLLLALVRMMRLPQEPPFTDQLLHGP